MALTLHGLMSRGDNIRRYQFCDIRAHSIPGLSYVDDCVTIAFISNQGKTNQVIFLHFFPDAMMMSSLPSVVSLLCKLFKDTRISMAMNMVQCGRNEWDFMARHSDVDVCPVGGLAIWLYYYFHIGDGLLDFSRREAW